MKSCYQTYSNCLTMCSCLLKFKKSINIVLAKAGMLMTVLEAEAHY